MLLPHFDLVTTQYVGPVFLFSKLVRYRDAARKCCWPSEVNSNACWRFPGLSLENQLNIQAAFYQPHGCGSGFGSESMTGTRRYNA